MDHLKTEKTFLMLKIDGEIKHIPTEITYSFEFESDAPDFELGCEIENEKERKRFESGELLNVMIQCKAYALGVNGFDYLGQCFVNAKNYADELLTIAADHDMKNSACKNLKEEIISNFKLYLLTLKGQRAADALNAS